MKSFLKKGLILAMSSMMFLSSCSDDDNNDQNPDPGPQSLTATLAADARFSVLVDALQRTGLDATLDASGTYTVFAPTDAAFTTALGDLGYNSLDELEAALTTAGLRNVLLYHVLGAEVMAADVSTGYASTAATNADGDALSLFINAGSEVLINDAATVRETDINASNGVAHVIDAVILPLSVYGLIQVNPDYSSLEAALGLADGNLDDVLSGDAAQYTLFAPNNAAFDTVVANTPGVNNLGELVAALGTDVLSTVLLYHVVDGTVLAADLSTGSVNTLASDGMGGQLDIFINIGTEVNIIDDNNDTQDAVVTGTDFVGTNGAMHTISSVLLPQ